MIPLPIIPMPSLVTVSRGLAEECTNLLDSQPHAIKVMEFVKMPDGRTARINCHRGPGDILQIEIDFLETVKP